MDYIVKKLKRDYQSKDSKLYFVTKKDLWNVATKYSLIPGIRHKNDLASLAMRSEEGNAANGIGFLNFRLKSQEKDSP